MADELVVEAEETENGKRVFVRFTPVETPQVVEEQRGY